jgi:hypothetical protein
LLNVANIFKFNFSKRLERLKWVYPIKAFSVINASNKSNPFVLECPVRKRLEKRIEVILTSASSFYTSDDRAALKLRSVTPSSGSDVRSPKAGELETTSLAQDFAYSVHYFGNADQCDVAKNSVALKLIRTEKDKGNGLVVLVFDFIFCPAKSFM